MLGFFFENSADNHLLRAACFEAGLFIFANSYLFLTTLFWSSLLLYIELNNINELNLDDAIKDFIASGKPFVGICLGFQLLFDKSDEIEDTFGLGILPGEVKSFSALNDKIRVPHVGWNNIKKKQIPNTKNNFDPLKKLNDQEYFYFVHSFYVEPEDNKDIYTTTEYGGHNFCSSILKENIFACQFHPEKSGEKGISILRDFFNK